MIQNTDIARRLGYLNISDDNLIDAYDLKGIPPEQVVIMCTGSQGEPLSALARIANGEHKTIEIEEGDTVIIEIVERNLPNILKYSPDLGNKTEP